MCRQSENYEPEAEVFRLRLSSAMAVASSALSLASEGEAVFDDANTEASLAVPWKPGCGFIIAGGKCERCPVDDVARGVLEYMDW